MSKLAKSRATFLSVSLLTVLLLGLILVQPAAADLAVEEWVVIHDGDFQGDDEAKVMALDSNEDIYVIGEEDVLSDADDLVTFKYNSDGGVVWSAFHGDAAADDLYAKGLAVDGSGNVYISGDLDGDDNDDQITIRYNSFGVEQWMKKTHYLMPYRDTKSGNVVVDQAGEAYVAGSMEDNWDGYYGHALTKYTTSGFPTWIKAYEDSYGYYYKVSRVTVGLDATGNAIVTGTKLSSHIRTTKYETGTGDFVWTKTYSAGTSSIFATAMKVTPAGQTCIGGYGRYSGGTMDFLTVKYDADGTRLWDRLFDGPVNGWDMGQDLAVDSSGNATNAGYIQGLDTEYDYGVVQYDTDGNLLWSASYDGPISGDDRASAAAVDDGGNVYVTGYSEGDGTDKDIVTIKYDANGNRSWLKRFNGAGNGDDEGQDLVVDSAGNVYVAGYTTNAAGDNDFVTIKYAQKICPTGYICLQTRLHGLWDGTEHTCETQVNVQFYGTVDYLFASTTVGRDGWVELWAANPFIPLPPGSYYVVLRHLNHIDLGTAAQVTWDGSTSVTVDFTDPANIECGESTMYEYSTGVWTMPAGDIDPDDRVALSDFNYLRTHWTETDPACDLDCDGYCRLGDFNKLRQTWNTQGCAPLRQCRFNAFPQPAGIKVEETKDRHSREGGNPETRAALTL